MVGLVNKKLVKASSFIENLKNKMEIELIKDSLEAGKRFKVSFKN